jgi:MraZ protein
VDENPSPKVVEPPRGFHQARVDEKGRLKLPTVFQQFLADLGEKQVFITTLDLRTIRIYRSSVWKENENLFENAGEDADSAEAVAFMAKHFGADSELDNQGRVLVPKELRQELRLENQPVWVAYDRGAIEGYGEAEYQQKLAASRSIIGTAVAALRKKGLK